MKKELVSTVFVFLLAMSVSGVCYSHSGDRSGIFKKALPIMKAMHQDMNDGQLEEMYQDCHDSDEGGIMEQYNQL